jgi:hypothetical protein
MSQKKIAEIRGLYERTTAKSVEADLTRAVEVLKSLPDEDTRQRAAVYMDGLSQMRSEWRLEKQRTRGRRTAPRPGRRG